MMSDYDNGTTVLPTNRQLKIRRRVDSLHLQGSRKRMRYWENVLHDRDPARLTQ
jgi:hypothetical protein